MPKGAPGKAGRRAIIKDWNACLTALLLLPVAIVAFSVAGFFLPCLWPFLVLGLLIAPYGTGWERWRAVVLGSSVLAAVVFVPWRLATYLAHALFPGIPLDLFHLASGPLVNPPPFAPVAAWVHRTRVIDWWLGASGLGVCVLGGVVTWVRNLRVARQIENLPTSKARSAAVGLAEFRGVARTRREGPDALGAIAVEGTTGRDVLQPFYLEDETGRIRVDPRGAASLSFFRVHLLGSVRFLCLTRPVPAGKSLECRLMPGDPVYVIGSVEPSAEAGVHDTDAERLVVRPSSDWVKPGPLDLVALMTDPLGPGVDVHHVFFLSDTTEQTAATVMRQTVWRTALVAALLASLSGALLLMVQGWS